jgi:hypothetical protein
MPSRSAAPERPGGDVIVLLPLSADGKPASNLDFACETPVAFEGRS